MTLKNKSVQKVKIVRKPTLAKKVANLTRAVKARRPEMKYINNSVSTVATLTQASPQTILLNGMAQGINENSERIGSKAQFKFFNMRIQFAADISTQTASSFFTYRIVIVKENPALGSLPSLSSYFTTSTPSSVTQRNLVGRNPDRYTTYFDKVFTLGNFAGGTATRTFKINKRLGFTTNYQRDTGATESAIEKNTFSMFLICDQTIASAVDIKYDYTMGYIDN